MISALAASSRILTTAPPADPDPAIVRSRPPEVRREIVEVTQAPDVCGRPQKLCWSGRSRRARCFVCGADPHASESRSLEFSSPHPGSKVGVPGIGSAVRRGLRSFRARGELERILQALRGLKNLSR